MSMTPHNAADMLAKLVGFDTVSRHSNLALIEFIEAHLAEYGVESWRVENDDGSKSNLIARIGPAVEGGVALSGHTDVVPVDGQPWYRWWRFVESAGIPPVGSHSSGTVNLL